MALTKFLSNLVINGANGTVLDVQGSVGQLFSVTDSLTGDLFAVSDISGIPILNVNSSGAVDIDGTLNLGDSDKIQLGASQDLQIYHDGTNSYISEVGTGDLIISADNDLTFKDGSGNIMANMNASNSVELMYGNSKKFETTSAGVAVTGDLTVTGTDIRTGSDGQLSLGDDSSVLSIGRGNEMWTQNSVNAAATLYVNYRGYNGGSTQFRSLDIRDGKAGQIANFNGSDKSVSFAGNVGVTGTIGASNFSGSSSGTNTGDQTLPTLSSLGALSASGGTMTGDLNLGDNQLVFSNTNVAAPSTTDTGAGTRILLYSPGGEGNHYAIGIESNNMWFNSDVGYKWYRDSSAVMTLDSSSNLDVTGAVTTGGKLTIGTVAATSTATTALFLGAANEVKKRSLGSNAFNSTAFSTATGVEDNADVTPSWVPDSDPGYSTLVIGTTATTAMAGNTLSTQDLTDIGNLSGTNTGDQNFSTLGAATRTNYTLKFQPPTSNYAGFQFLDTSGNGAGYLLVRGTSDNDVYTAEGITLVADAGWLTLAQRNTSDKGIKFMTGATAATRMTIANDGDININNSLTVGADLGVNGAIKDSLYKHTGSANWQTKKYVRSVGITGGDIGDSWVQLSRVAISSSYEKVTIKFTINGYDDVSSGVEAIDVRYENGASSQENHQSAWYSTDDHANLFKSVRSIRSASNGLSNTYDLYVQMAGDWRDNFTVVAESWTTHGDSASITYITANGSATEPSAGDNDINNGERRWYTENAYMYLGGNRVYTTNDFSTSDFATASHSHSAATTSAAGFMSSADKTKLDGVATGADVTPSWVPGTDPSYLTSLPSHNHDSLYHKLDFDAITGAHDTDAKSGTWTGSEGSSWGSYKPGNDSDAGSYYNDGTGYAQYNIPSGYTTAYIGQLKWDSGGYFDVYAVDSNGNLVLRGRYMSLQTIENSNHNGNHDYQQIIKISGLDGFSSIRIQNRTGRVHLQGIGWTKEEDTDSTADALSHWDLIYGKPSTFAPTIGTTATTALAGNTSLLQIGTTATTAMAGNTSLFDGAYGSLSGLPTLGTAAAAATEDFATAAQGTTADAALPKAGGTMTGNLAFNTGYTLSVDTAITDEIRVGDRVTLTESTDRTDLLYINSSTDGWGGLQIGNTSNEFIFSLMGNGSIGGIYDDQNSDWLIQWTENQGVSLYFENSDRKLQTISTGVAITGDIKIDSALLSNQENTDVDTGTETVATVAHATYTAAFFDFVIKNGTNVRAGTVYSCHDGTNVEFTETSTVDLGNTSDVTLTVDISGTDMRLRATTTSDNWSVKSLVRAI